MGLGRDDGIRTVVANDRYNGEQSAGLRVMIESGRGGRQLAQLGRSDGMGHQSGGSSDWHHWATGGRRTLAGLFSSGGGDDSREMSMLRLLTEEEEHALIVYVIE